MNAISPIDGRYTEQVKELQKYFSESALMRYRIKVEVEYLIQLSKTLNKPEILELNNYHCGCQHFPNPREDWTDEQHLRDMYEYEEFDDYECLKEYEKKTNHDVKAIELYIAEDMRYPQWVHFGLTSQDITNTAVPLMLKDALNDVMFPWLKKVMDKIDSYCEGIGFRDKPETFVRIPMLSRTHGQPATPTDLGHQFIVFHRRLLHQVYPLKTKTIQAKFGGATGLFNAHKLAYPNIQWNVIFDRFIHSLGLKRTEYTTQIEPYDNLGEWCHAFSRINTIFIDFCRDIWQYISMGYFKLKVNSDEVGSSTMPHKVNPIDFENAEGNLGVANALFNHFATKLPISRLQRDLTDSTVLRNIGVPFAHSLLAYKNILKGLEKLEVCKETISQDLNSHWEILTEAVQTILRREGVKDAYDILKKFSRENAVITQEILHTFIDTLEISEDVKKELKDLRPDTY